VSTQVSRDPTDVVERVAQYFQRSSQRGIGSTFGHGQFDSLDTGGDPMRDSIVEISRNP